MKTRSTRSDRASLHANACSRPPLPITRILSEAMANADKAWNGKRMRVTVTRWDALSESKDTVSSNELNINSTAFPQSSSIWRRYWTRILALHVFLFLSFRKLNDQWTKIGDIFVSQTTKFATIFHHQSTSFLPPFVFVLYLELLSRLQWPWPLGDHKLLLKLRRWLFHATSCSSQTTTFHSHHSISLTIFKYHGPYISDFYKNTGIFG